MSHLTGQAQGTYISPAATGQAQGPHTSTQPPPVPTFQGTARPQEGGAAAMRGYGGGQADVWGPCGQYMSNKRPSRFVIPSLRSRAGSEGSERSFAGQRPF